MNKEHSYPDYCIIHILSFKQNNQAIKYCPEFAISGYGITDQEAYHSFQENLNTLIETFESNIDQLHLHLIEDCGWQAKRGSEDLVVVVPQYLDYYIHTDPMYREIVVGGASTFVQEPKSFSLQREIELGLTREYLEASPIV